MDGLHDFSRAARPALEVRASSLSRFDGATSCLDEDKSTVPSRGRDDPDSGSESLLDFQVDPVAD